MKKLLLVIGFLLATTPDYAAGGGVSTATARRIVTFFSAPSGCVEGDKYYNLTSHTEYTCTSAGTWTATGGGGVGTGTVTSVGLAGTANQITVTGASPITNSGSWILSFPAGGVTLPATTTGTFSGNLTGNVTGNTSGTSGSTTGNAATATILQTARTINGDSFDGSGNVQNTLASSDFANQGTTTGLLHGNASGNPGWGPVVNADITANTIDVATKLTGTLLAAQEPAHTGDATNSAGSLAMTLASVGAGAGSCTFCSATVDAKGRVTAYSSGSGFTAPTGTGVVTVTSGALDAASTGTSGTGNFVRVTSPTLVTPVLGAASATTIAVTPTNSTNAITFTAASAGAGTVTTSGTLVTGSGTSFLAQIGVGDSFTPGAQTAKTVVYVSDNTHLRLSTSADTNAAGLSYTITPTTHAIGASGYDSQITTSRLVTLAGTAAAPAISIGWGGVTPDVTLNRGFDTDPGGNGGIVVDDAGILNFWFVGAQLRAVSGGIIGFTSNSGTAVAGMDVAISRGDVAGDLDCGTGAAQSVGCRFRASAVTMNINATAKTANYTTLATDYTILATTAGGAFTITLSSTNAKAGQIYNIKMTATSANALTLSPSSGNIDGVASATITPTTLKEGAMVQFDGTNWWIVGTYSGVL